MLEDEINEKLRAIIGNHELYSFISGINDEVVGMNVMYDIDGKRERMSILDAFCLEHNTELKELEILVLRSFGSTDLNQEQVAERMGISRATVSRNFNFVFDKLVSIQDQCR